MVKYLRILCCFIYFSLKSFEILFRSDIVISIYKFLQELGFRKKEERRRKRKKETKLEREKSREIERKRERKKKR